MPESRGKYRAGRQTSPPERQPGRYKSFDKFPSLQAEAADIVTTQHLFWDRMNLADCLDKQDHTGALQPAVEYLGQLANSLPIVDDEIYAEATKVLFSSENNPYVQTPDHTGQ